MKAVVTGAASGIGRACAVRLAADARARDETATLLLVDVSPGPLEQLVGELVAQGADATGLTVDLADPEAGATVAAAAAERLGGVDVLVSNAGIAIGELFATLPLADWDKTFAVNTRATFLLAQALRPLLAASRGCLVATASVSASEPTPPLGAYSASKAALVMLVRQLAYEWGREGIRCNCVSPGMVHTGLTDATYSNPEIRAERSARVPLQRIGAPEDIAAAVSFLTGPDAAYVTGVNLAVDGGLQTVLMPQLRGIVGA